MRYYININRNELDCSIKREVLSASNCVNWDSASGQADGALAHPRLPSKVLN